MKKEERKERETFSGHDDLINFDYDFLLSPNLITF